MRHPVSALSLLVLVLAGCTVSGSSRTRSSSFSPTAKLATAKASGDFEILVDQGTVEDAAVYAQYISDKLGIAPSATLDQVLAFVGYGSITGREVEVTASDDLMRRFPGEVLATRFFAPKIIDVSDIGGPPDTKDLGWRKLVRFNARADSEASRKGIGSMFLLFNVFQPRAEVRNDPFGVCAQDVRRCSQNNQVIFVVRNPPAGSDSVYWLVFENAAMGGGLRTNHLKATFDGGDQASATDKTPVKKYFLPDACAQCHGSSASTAKLNYLDSDHWNDRIQNDDDFAIVGKDSEHGVLFDGGRDVGSQKFQSAFAIVRALNSEIRIQNEKAGGETFPLRAVDHWLKLHRANTGFVAPIERALPPPQNQPNAKVWQRGNAADESLLPLLNRYCYRCHSSVAYHVFDKQAVFQRRNGMAGRVERGPETNGGMPQDRRLSADLKRDLATRLRALQ